MRRCVKLLLRPAKGCLKGSAHLGLWPVRAEIVALLYQSRMAFVAWLLQRLLSRGTTRVLIAAILWAFVAVGLWNVLAFTTRFWTRRWLMTATKNDSKGRPRRHGAFLANNAQCVVAYIRGQFASN